MLRSLLVVAQTGKVCSLAFGAPTDGQATNTLSAPCSFDRCLMKRNLFPLTGIMACLGLPGTPLPAAHAQGGLADAASYCRAVGNADRAGARYTGPRVPRWMMRALGAGPSAAAQVDWRCMGGRVFACFDGGASQHCSQADTSRVPTQAMHEECHTNPGAPMMPTAVTGSLTVFDWGCRGRSPVILRQTVRVDARGYPEGLYRDITGSAPPASAAPDSTITTDGMAGVRVGMTRRQIAPMTKPWVDSADAINNFECATYPTRSELAVVMVQRGIVTRVATTSPRLSTRSGAQVGMTERTLRKMYGTRIVRDEDQYSTPNDPSWNYYYYSNDGNGIRFDVHGGKVNAIMSGKRSAIRLAEGCA